LTALRQHRGFFILIGFAAVLFLSDIWAYKEFVRAESYFALGARSMVERSEWLTPHAPDELQLNKPPLTYWLIGASYKAFGASYGTARLPSVLAAIAVLAIVYLLGAWLHGTRTGLISAAMLASSYLFLSFARMAMSDLLLTLCVTGAFACFVAALTQPTPVTRKLVFAGYVAMALGILTKGPVALALVGIPIGLEVLARRNRASLKHLRLLLGLVLFLLIAGPYFVLVYTRAGIEPLRFFFLGENLQRFTGQIYETGARPFWYELTAFFTDFAPWSPLLFLAVWFDWRQPDQDLSKRSARRMLYLWLTFTVVMFSLASFKRDYYLLPAMPVAALIIGSLMARADRLSTVSRRVLAIFLVICALAVLTAASFSLQAASELSVHTSLRFVPVAIALAGLVAMIVCLTRRKTWQSSLVLMATIWATILSMQLILLPAFTRYLPATQLAAAVPEGRIVYISRAANDWANCIAFNLPAPHRVERISGDLNDTKGNDEKLLAVLASNPKSVAIVWEHEYAGLVKNDMTLRILADVETYGHGGLSLNLIRHPARQRLLLIGHAG